MQVHSEAAFLWLVSARTEFNLTELVGNEGIVQSELPCGLKE